MMKSKVVALIMSVVMLLAANSVVMANGRYEREVLNKVQRINNSFLSDETVSAFKSTNLVTPWGDAKLIEFLSDNYVAGYAIAQNMEVLEFSEGVSPYNGIHCQSGEQFYYDFSTYCVVNDTQANALRERVCELQDYLISTEFSTASNVRTEHTFTLPNVSPQRQNGTNCVATALANVMWYWGGHGYSELTAGKTFAMLKTTIANGFYGNYSNNSVLTVANNYAQSYDISFTGGANWNPTFWTVYNEINALYPCMVGFAAGSEYSSIYGHMTMCYGYYYNFEEGAGPYVQLADGHSTSMVEKLWTSYNDCVITLHIHDAQQ